MYSSGNGVYEAEPIIKLENGSELRKTNNRGKSTFFPDDWDEARILEEVEHAINNNHGRVPDSSTNEYFGYSKNGGVKIHFYYNTDSSVGSYYPVKN
ncbi:EndoU domain-containing protein [Capnocytophaga canimorsus]|uniref:EndoU domain-containing protein n=1 Tax=Capnocytophaga canimorsus TaxID=28188 RepID=UPI0037D1A8BB